MAVILKWAGIFSIWGQCLPNDKCVGVWGFGPQPSPCPSKPTIHPPSPSEWQAVRSCLTPPNSSLVTLGLQGTGRRYSWPTKQPHQIIILTSWHLHPPNKRYPPPTHTLLFFLFLLCVFLWLQLKGWIRCLEVVLLFLYVVNILPTVKEAKQWSAAVGFFWKTYFSYFKQWPPQNSISV